MNGRSEGEASDDSDDGRRRRIAVNPSEAARSPSRFPPTPICPHGRYCSRTVYDEVLGQKQMEDVVVSID